MFNADADNAPCTLSGFAAGCAGGFIATWIMSAVQTATVTAADQLEAHQAQTPEGAKAVAAGEGMGGGPLENAQEATVATKRMASRLAHGLFGCDLTSDERATVAGIIPLAFGTLVGGIYGALAEHWKPISIGNGTAYGTAVWLGAEELALPMLQLTKPPTQAPWSSHAAGLAGHLVYGMALDAARRAIRPFLR